MTEWHEPIPGLRIRGAATALEARLGPKLVVGERFRRRPPGEPPDPCDPGDTTIYTVIRVTGGTAAIGKRVQGRDQKVYDWKTNSETRVPGEIRMEVQDYISAYSKVFRVKEDEKE